jgi:nucleoside 2-deoxyribosyltransferase
MSGIQVGYTDPTIQQKYDEGYAKVFKKKKLVYLAGAIELSTDKGIGWREKITPVLQNLGYDIINPCQEQNTNDFSEDLKQAKFFDIPTFRTAVQKIITRDLQLILGCDLIICLWDGPSSGTSGELTYAYANKIPIYTVETTRRPDTSNWIIGCSTEWFTNFSDLESFLNGKD